jgi:hypothetical protein
MRQEEVNMALRKEILRQLKTYFVSRRGDNHGIQGGMFPDITDTHDLGSTTRRWDAVYAQSVIADNLSGSGVPDEFTDLTDTPGSYSGEQTKVLMVNSGQNAVEFINLVAGDGITKTRTTGVDTLDVDLAATSGLSFTGGELQVDDTLAGSGLSIASKVISVNESYGFNFTSITIGTLTISTSITMPEDGWIGIGAGSERLVFNGSEGKIEVQNSDLDLAGNSLLGTGDISFTGNITMSEDTWIGIGDSLERIIFDGTGGVIQIAAANLDLVGNSIVGTSVDISNAELQQLSNIGVTTISVTQWGYLGAMDQGVATGDTPIFNGVSLTGNLALAANSITGTTVDISNAELQQLSNIGATTISSGQWSSARTILFKEKSKLCLTVLAVLMAVDSLFT